jgi:hypothetical protein
MDDSGIVGEEGEGALDEEDEPSLSGEIRGVEIYIYII